MSVTTTIDAAVIEGTVKQYGLTLAPDAGALRGSGQRACLMNLGGSPQDRVAAMLAQPRWKGESESKAIDFHNWYIREGYLPKDTSEHRKRARRPSTRADGLKPHSPLPHQPRTLERVVNIPAEGSSAVLPTELVLSRINCFWGYGALSAPVWFVGMEESIPPTITIDSQLLKSRFEAADGKQTIDIRDNMQDVLDHIQWFRPGARMQLTWRYPIALFLYLMLNRIPTREEIRTYQTTVLGDIKVNGSVAVELMPLPSQKANQSTWVYGKLDVPALKTRAEYLKTYKPDRVKKLVGLLHEYRPRLVIFHTLAYRKDLEAIIGANLDCIATFTVSKNPAKTMSKVNMYATLVNGALFCAIPQNNSFGMSYERLYEYADRLKKKFTIPQTQYFANARAVTGGGDQGQAERAG